jgi:hypothetical protein
LTTAAAAAAAAATYRTKQKNSRWQHAKDKIGVSVR